MSDTLFAMGQERSLIVQAVFEFSNGFEGLKAYIEIMRIRE